MEILDSLDLSSTLMIKHCNTIPKKTLSFQIVMLQNANIGIHRKTLMTLAKTGSEVLTKEEWNELIALKEAITYAPQTVSAQKMEKFAELMVRSLEGKESNTPQ